MIKQDYAKTSRAYNFLKRNHKKNDLVGIFVTGIITGFLLTVCGYYFAYIIFMFLTSPY